MKLVDLLINQNIIVQLTWGEQKIEFSSEVIEKANDAVFVTSYLHNGSELQLNITGDTGVVCNVFADDTTTGQRISWRNIELTTVEKNNRTMYCLKTYGFNHVANLDERRNNERTLIQLEGKVTDVNNEETQTIIVRDISGVGVAFYAPESYSPKSQQVTVMFSDIIDTKKFDVSVECSILRMNNENGHMIVGCRLVGENRDYQLYRFIKHIKSKSKNKAVVPENVNQAAKPEEGKPVEKAEDENNAAKPEGETKQVEAKEEKPVAQS